MMLGDTCAALRSYETVLQLDPTNATAMKEVNLTYMYSEILQYLNSVLLIWSFL